MKVDLTQIIDDVFRFQTNTIGLKFREASTIFIENKNDLEYSQKILKHTDALLFKFTLAVINLEFLWQISDLKKPLDPVRPNQELYEWNNADSIIDSLFLESTVIQIRSFIDFAQKLSCVCLGYTKPIDGTKDFYKILRRMDSDKSREIEDTFMKVDESWGKIVRSVRDKILHYDLIKTNHDLRPSIAGKHYEDFGQGLSNDMFEFLIELCEDLFEVKWVPGTLEQFRSEHNR